MRRSAFALGLVLVFILGAATNRVVYKVDAATDTLHLGGSYAGIVFDDPVTLPSGSWTLQQAYTSGDTVAVTNGNPIEVSSAVANQKLLSFINDAAAEKGWVDEDGDARLESLLLGGTDLALTRSAASYLKLTDNSSGNGHLIVGYVAPVPQAFTIADSGGAGVATSSATPSSSAVDATCSDADGCEWTLGETTPQDGTLLSVVNIGTNSLVMINSAGVAQLVGAANQTLGQYDAITLRYIGDRWVQEAPVANN